MPELLAPPSTSELTELTAGSGNTLRWWCSVLRGWDGLLDPDQEASERQLVTFMGSGPIAVNVHDVTWESDEGWGWCNGIAAWRNETGGEPLSTVGFVPRLVEAGDTITIRAGALRMSAKELQA